jgi:large subunit ribosomal protein L15
MRLNSIQPAEGSRPSKRRLGRGIGSGLGKTSGKGHKGQKARAGGFHKVGFEGGQMPLQRRLPKVGFRSRTAHLTAEVTLRNLSNVAADTIDLTVLKQAGLIPAGAQRVKVILKGEVDRPLHIKGLGVSAGARKVIEDKGGRIEA